MTDDLTPAQHAVVIEAARQRLQDFVEGCSDEQWLAAPVDGDPRPVAVIADHVAHAYEYLASWMTETLAGQSPEITSGIVDELNAVHAGTIDAQAGNLGSITRAHVVDHLKTSGDGLISLVRGLEPAQLDLGDGQVRRLAIVAARHADSHRDEIEASLSAS